MLAQAQLVVERAAKLVLTSSRFPSAEDEANKRQKLDALSKKFAVAIAKLGTHCVLSETQVLEEIEALKAELDEKDRLIEKVKADLNAGAQELKAEPVAVEVIDDDVGAFF